jgi:hypothetical protein
VLVQRMVGAAAWAGEDPCPEPGLAARKASISP